MMEFYDNYSYRGTRSTVPCDDSNITIYKDYYTYIGSVQKGLPCGHGEVFVSGKKYLMVGGK